jgi:hypothetical protein
MNQKILKNLAEESDHLVEVEVAFFLVQMEVLAIIMMKMMKLMKMMKMMKMMKKMKMMKFIE